MRILILTQPLHYNYGGLLQAYALQQVLRSMGHDVVTDRNGVTPKSLWYRVSHFVYHAIRFYILKDYRYYPYRYLFLSFNKENMILKIIGTNMKNFVDTHIATISFFERNAKTWSNKAQFFDAIVVGSDQVWRATMSDIPVYFLSFTEGLQMKRIAYAASFGTDNLDEYSKVDLKAASKYIKLFDAVSLREDSGVQICRNFFKMNVAHVLDPTMLLTKDDYLDLIEDEDKPHSSGMLLTYILDQTPKKKEIMQKVSDALHLKPHENGPTKYFSNVKDDNLSECVYPSVSKWLAGFRDAQFVVTDSFHGMVFSIIFNKPFIVILNIERGASRFISLLSMFHLENRVVAVGEELRAELLMPIDYESVNKILDSLKEASLDYLKQYL